ncbi:MAG: SagB/ThcOx family dehydrogenase [Planctomycetota bacterium]
MTVRADPGRDRAAVLAYHERTKHHYRRFAAGPHGLDWANQPHPVRRWPGAELVPLDLLPPSAGAAAIEPPYAAAMIAGHVAPAPLARRSISQLLYDSLALSAWKEAGGSHWALRVNPSSGNLHPTEGYLLLPPIEGIAGEAAVWHYAPLEHGLEKRAEIPTALWARLAAGLPAGAFLAALTSIHWREAWKYGERAYRYCQHDAGHAIAALSFAAAGLGWDVELLDTPGTDEVGALCGVFAEVGPEAEHADCLLVVRPRGTADRTTRAHLAAEVAPAFRALAWRGTANQLSPEHVEWRAIDVVAGAARKPRTAEASVWEPPGGRPAPPADGVALRTILHQRRSGVDFDGRTGASAATFHRLLASVVPRAGLRSFDVLGWRPRLDLLLFVHRIEGHEPGLYWLARDPARLAAVRAALRPDLLWRRPVAGPDDLSLYLLHAADLRGAAADVSCQQEIAAHGA